MVLPPTVKITSSNIVPNHLQGPDYFDPNWIHVYRTRYRIKRAIAVHKLHNAYCSFGEAKRQAVCCCGLFKRS